MKKRILPALLALAMVLTMLPMAVFAEDPPAANETLPEAIDNVITLTENVTLKATYEVAADASIVIDLAGFKITAPAGKKAIEVKPGGTLEIKDTSAAKTGEVTRTDDVKVYVIQNSGTMTLSGGTISSTATGTTTLGNRSTDNAKGAKLTIKGGAVKAKYIAIKNDRLNGNEAEPELVIEGGIIAAGNDQVVQNWGTATIKDGKFSGCVGTWTDGSKEIGKTTIEGGSFDLEGSAIAPSAVLALFQYNENAKQGQLKITGDITVDNTLPESVLGDKPVPKAVGVAVMAQGGNKPVDKTPEGLEVVVSAGTYSVPVDPQYLADNLKFEAVDGSGNYTYHATQDAAEAAAGEDGTVSKKSEDGTEMEPIIKIKATGFIWDMDDEDAVQAAMDAGTQDKDTWVDQTIWVAFDQALPAGAHYWFDVEINGETYGIAANGDGTHKVHAFSFLNPGQWEVPPTELLNEDGTGLKDEFTGSDMTATITVYKTAAQLSQAPTDDEKAQLEKVGEPTTVTVPAKPANANPNLKITSVTTDAPLYAKVTVSGMDTSKVYAIRLAKDQYKNNGEMTILIVDNVTDYNIYCKDGQKIWVFEYASKDAIVAGGSQHTSVVEGTAQKMA